MFCVEAELFGIIAGLRKSGGRRVDSLCLEITGDCGVSLSLDGLPDGVEVRGAAVGVGVTVSRSSEEESEETALELRTAETPRRGNRRRGCGTGAEEVTGVGVEASSELPEDSSIARVGLIDVPKPESFDEHRSSLNNVVMDWKLCDLERCEKRAAEYSIFAKNGMFRLSERFVLKTALRLINCVGGSCYCWRRRLTGSGPP